MASPIDDCEILVHVDAPALAANDAQYRRLAQAYLAFQPHTSTCLSDSGSCSAEDLRQKDCATTSDAHLLDREHFPASPNGEQPLTDSQDLSFDGAIDNRDSPRLRVDRGSVHEDKLVIPSSLPEVASSQGSWCAPPSEIGDSYPMPTVLSYTSPSRILRQWSTTHPTVSSTPNVTKEALPSQLAGHASSQREDYQRGSDQLPGLREPASTAPNIILATPPSPTSIRKRARNSEDTENDNADITHVSASDPSQPLRPAPSPRAESEPLLSKKSKTSHASSYPRNEIKPLGRSASDSASRRREVSSNSLEIWASSPPVGINDIVPSDFVSEKLNKLSKQLSSRYRPQASRDIQPFERGYWLLDCTTWSADIHLSFWEFLKTYLESGLAGWGVWCRRDENRRWVRFYCWGHIVKHIYLLLYLASDRVLKMTGAEWRDAGGDLVVRVSPTGKIA